MDVAESTPSHDGYAQGLNLTISLCLTYTLCVVIIRWWIRKGSFGVDDFVVLAATTFTIGHTAADYVALANGLGKPWSQITYTPGIARIHESTIAGVILFWIALYLSKLAVLAFLIRMTKDQAQLRAYYVGIGLICTLALISVLVASADCPSPGGFYWAFSDNQRSCPSQSTRWQVLTAFDTATELGLLTLPVQLVWGLQMPIRKKAVVLTAFYLRLPVVAISVAREVFTSRLNSRGSDPSFGGAMVVIWLEIELAYALATNTLSALKAFTASFNSGFGQGFTRGKGSQYDMSGLSKDSGQSSKGEKQKSEAIIRSASPALSLGAIARELTTQDRGQSPNSFIKLRPDHNGEHVARISAEPTRFWRIEHHKTSSDNSGDDMVIMRETELSIHHDEAPILKIVQ